MDLRIIKTRGQIKAAFLRLREYLMPDKIRVKDICALAMINKTTFYNHYTDSAQLCEEIDDGAIEQVVCALPEPQSIFEDSRAYIARLFEALEKESDNLRLIFRGKQDVLCSKLEARLHSSCEVLASNPEEETKLSFAIGGFVRVVRDFLFADTLHDIDRLSDMIAKMLEPLSQRFQVSEQSV